MMDPRHRRRWRANVALRKKARRQLFGTGSLTNSWNKARKICIYVRRKDLQRHRSIIYHNRNVYYYYVLLLCYPGRMQAGNLYLQCEPVNQPWRKSVFSKKNCGKNTASGNFIRLPQLWILWTNKLRKPKGTACERVEYKWHLIRSYVTDHFYHVKVSKTFLRHTKDRCLSLQLGNARSGICVTLKQLVDYFILPLFPFFMPLLSWPLSHYRSLWSQKLNFRLQLF